MRSRRFGIIKCALFLSFLVGVWPALPVLAQAKAASSSGSRPPAAEAAPPTAKPALEPYPVKIDGKVVIEVQWGVANMTPEIRAKGIAERVERLAKDPTQPPTLTMNPGELTVDVMAGKQIIASVFNGDAQAAGTTQEALATKWRDALSGSIEEYRLEHSRERLLKRIGLALLVLFATLAVLWILIPLTRWAARRTTDAILDRLAHSKRRGWSLLDTEQLRGILWLAFRLVRLALSLLTLYATFQILFLIFPRTRPLGERMLEGVWGPISQFGQEAWTSAPSLIFIVIIVTVCRYIVQLVSFAFTRIAEGQVHIEGFRAQWAPVTARLVNLAIILLAILIAYPYIPGSQSAAFKGFSLFLGVLVSLGSTGVVANVLNGIVLTYMDAFEVGDFIEVGGAQGYVEETSLFVTRLKTRQGRVITVPNSAVLSSQIVNHSKAGPSGERMLSLSATAGIGYDAPWRQVEAMLLNAAKKTSTVLEVPPPRVVEVSLNTFDITYELTVFLTGEKTLNLVRAELNRNILDQFNEYGVQIMTPAYEGDPAKPAVVAKKDWFAAPAVKPEERPKSDNLESPSTTNLQSGVLP